MRMLKWFGLVLVFAGVTGGASAGVIYSDDFSGTSTENLNGLAPDITDGTNKWQVLETGETWKSDGSIAAPGGNQNRNAFLAFTPESGKVYTLSLTMNPQNDDFFTLGFAGGNSLSGSFTSDTDPAAAPWMFIQYDHTLVSRTYYGPGIAGNLGLYPDGSWGTDVDLAISLDTTESDWTVEWFINGESLRTYTYSGGNPTINYVGFGRQGQASGYVDNFELSVIPEPVSMGLLGMGGLFVLLFRRKY